MIPTPTGVNPNARHMFVVCNDPTEFDDVFLLPLSSVRKNDPQTDDACILLKHEYSRLRHETYVAYRHAKVSKAATIVREIESGEFTVLADLNGQTFLRVLGGINKTKRIKPKLKSQWEDIKQQSRPGS